MQLLTDFEFPLIRMLSGFCVGLIMCVLGQYSQLLTRNNLSSTSTLGVDGHGLFLVMFTYLLSFFLHLEDHFYSIGLGLIGLGSLIIIFFLPTLAKINSLQKSFAQKMILFGLSFNLLIGSMLSIAHFLLIAFNFQFPSELWFGSLKFTSESKFCLLILGTLTLLIYHFYRFKSLLVFNFHLKIIPRHLPRSGRVVVEICFLTFLLTSLIILLFGLFPFLSLILPILIRELPGIKGSLIRELVYGGVLSGFFIMLIDLLSYNFPIFSMELPLGMLSSVLGSLLLLFYLVSSQKNKRW